MRPHTSPQHARTGLRFADMPAKYKLRRLVRINKRSFNLTSTLVRWIFSALVAIAPLASAETQVEKFNKSLSKIFSDATAGNVIAQAKLGKMYYLGEGLPRDFKEAEKWLHLAADQENAAALNNLGLMYLAGEGVDRDQTEGTRLVRMAADLGLAVAQYNLGTSYRSGREGVPHDANEWLRLTDLAAKQGYAPALYDLGRF